jgi:hypothetical protein
VNRRKEIENETKNYNIHESLKPRQKNENSIVPLATESFSMFKRASEMLQDPTEDVSPSLATAKPISKPFEKRDKPKTLSGLKSLKKKKKEQITNSSTLLLCLAIKKKKRQKICCLIFFTALDTYLSITNK